MLDTATSATSLVLLLSIRVRACSRTPHTSYCVPLQCVPFQRLVQSMQASRACLKVELLCVGREWDVAQGRPGALAGQLPWHQIAVVLRHGH